MRLSSEQFKQLLIWVAIAIAGVAVIIGVALIAAASSPASRTSVSAASAETSTPATATASLATSASVPATPTSPGGAPLSAYQGLGSWVDIYDTPAWRNPIAALDDMKKHGVRTVFVQTGHYHLHDPWFNKAKLERFIVEGHKRGMYVVAWYLPNMKPGSVDYQRVKWAIDFRTADGEKFDSFALDIESSAIPSDYQRNRGLALLADQIRSHVGPTYPLGGIIPAPVGLRHDNSVWHDFPYATVGRYFDVILPMSYYTYHGGSASTAYSDVRSNLAILRSQPGCSTVPVHLIGGEAEDSSAQQVAWFVRGVLEGKCLGASLYTWAGTGGAQWKALAAIKP